MLFDHLSRCLEKGLHSDVTLVAPNGTRITAHQAILAISSARFALILEGGKFCCVSLTRLSAPLISILSSFTCYHPSTEGPSRSGRRLLCPRDHRPLLLLWRVPSAGEHSHPPPGCSNQARGQEPCCRLRELRQPAPHRHPVHLPSLPRSSHRHPDGYGGHGHGCQRGEQD